MKQNREWTRIDANKEKSKNEPQMDADRVESLRSAQGNFPNFWALDNEIAQRFRRKKKHGSHPGNLRLTALNEP